MGVNPKDRDEATVPETRPLFVLSLCLREEIECRGPCWCKTRAQPLLMHDVLNWGRMDARSSTPGTFLSTRLVRVASISWPQRACGDALEQGSMSIAVRTPMGTNEPREHCKVSPVLKPFAAKMLGCKVPPDLLLESAFYFC